MENIDIRAKIPYLKLQEFKQSKLSFLEELEGVDGYIGYTESPGEDYNIVIEWKSRQQLDSFLDSELYYFFRGAIQTLGEVSKITVQSNKEIQKLFNN